MDLLKINLVLKILPLAFFTLFGAKNSLNSLVFSLET